MPTLSLDYPPSSLICISFVPVCLAPNRFRKCCTHLFLVLLVSVLFLLILNFSTDSHYSTTFSPSITSLNLLPNNSCLFVVQSSVNLFISRSPYSPHVYRVSVLSRAATPNPSSNVTPTLYLFRRFLNSKLAALSGTAEKLESITFFITCLFEKKKKCFEILSNFPRIDLVFVCYVFQWKIDFFGERFEKYIYI